MLLEAVDMRDMHGSAHATDVKTILSVMLCAQMFCRMTAEIIRTAFCTGDTAGQVNSAAIDLTESNRMLSH